MKLRKFSGLWGEEGDVFDFLQQPTLLADGPFEAPSAAAPVEIAPEVHRNLSEFFGQGQVHWLFGDVNMIGVGDRNVYGLLGRGDVSALVVGNDNLTIAFASTAQLTTIGANNSEWVNGVDVSLAHLGPGGYVTVSSVWADLLVLGNDTTVFSQSTFGTLVGLGDGGYYNLSAFSQYAYIDGDYHRTTFDGGFLSANLSGEGGSYNLNAWGTVQGSSYGSWTDGFVSGSYVDWQSWGSYSWLGVSGDVVRVEDVGDFTHLTAHASERLDILSYGEHSSLYAVSGGALDLTAYNSWSRVTAYSEDFLSARVMGDYDIVSLSANTVVANLSGFCNSFGIEASDFAALSLDGALNYGSMRSSFSVANIDGYGNSLTMSGDWSGDLSIGVASIRGWDNTAWMGNDINVASIDYGNTVVAYGDLNILSGTGTMVGYNQTYFTVGQNGTAVNGGGSANFYTEGPGQHTLVGSDSGVDVYNLNLGHDRWHGTVAEYEQVQVNNYQVGQDLIMLSAGGVSINASPYIDPYIEAMASYGLDTHLQLGGTDLTFVAAQGDGWIFKG